MIISCGWRVMVVAAPCVELMTNAIKLHVNAQLPAELLKMLSSIGMPSF